MKKKKWSKGGRRRKKWKDTHEEMRPGRRSDTNWIGGRSEPFFGVREEARPGGGRPQFYNGQNRPTFAFPPAAHHTKAVPTPE